MSTKIMNLSQEINQLRNLNDKIRNENRKLRLYYKVPDEFGENLDLLEENFENIKENKQAQIKYLTREVEELEEDRASLKCKLRQLSALINLKNN